MKYLLLLSFLVLSACSTATVTINMERTRRLNSALQKSVGSDSAARVAEAGIPMSEREPVVLKLDLIEAQALAAGQNRGLLLEALNSRLSGADVLREEAFTDIVLSANANISRAESALESVFVGDSRSESTESTYRADIGATAKYFTGTSVDLRYDLRKVETNSPFNSFSWSTNLNLTISQPLLDGFGYVANRTGLDIARNDLQAAHEDFLSRSNLISFDVAEAWWNLVLATEDLGVLEEQVETAEAALKRAEDRKERGRDKRLDVLRARSTMKSRQRDVIEAKLEVERRSDALLRIVHPDLLYGYSLVEGYRVRVAPSFELSAELGELEAVPALHGELARAFRQRRDLAAALLRIRSAGLRVVQRENQLLPKLDAEISAGLTGLEDDYGDAVVKLFETKSNRISAGLSFEIPFGNRSDRSNLESAKVEQERTILQAREVESTIIIETLDAIRDIAAKRESLGVAEESRNLAREEYRDIQELRKRGFSTSFEEREAEDTLTGAERDFVRAQVELRLAWLSLRKATGDLVSTKE